MLKYHYVALQRLRKKMMRAALILGVGSILELALAAIGGYVGGLDGLTEGWIVAVVLQAVLIVPGIVVATSSPLSTRGIDVEPLASPPQSALGTP